MPNFNLPEEAHWKPPVDTVGDLPTEDNEEGDARIVLSDGTLYYWDGVAWLLISGGGGGGTGNSYFPGGW